MRGLARHFHEGEETWGLAGLLHDVDYEVTKEHLGEHSLLAATWLEERGFPPAVVRAVKVHNDAHGLPLESQLERCLICADAISGLIVAAALVLPSRKLADLAPERVIRRFREKDFARGVNRDEILRCVAEGLPLEAFIAISLDALRGIAPSLSL